MTQKENASSPQKTQMKKSELFRVANVPGQEKHMPVYYTLQIYVFL